MATFEGGGPREGRSARWRVGWDGPAGALRRKLDIPSVSNLLAVSKDSSSDVVMAVTFGGDEPIHIALGAALDSAELSLVTRLSDPGEPEFSHPPQAIDAVEWWAGMKVTYRPTVAKGTCMMLKVKASSRTYTLAMHVEDVAALVTQPEVVKASTDGVAKSELRAPKLADGEVSLLS